MSVYELLERTPNPTDEEIKETLGGHICRCTGYQAIMKSARLAAQKLSARLQE
jgi:carbon-monoxide dehydrogenase small subunit